MHAIARGTDPPAGDALRATEQTTGQRQGRCLVDTEPVSFHELDPADHRAEGRVDLMDLHPLPAAAGQEIRKLFRVEGK